MQYLIESLKELDIMSFVIGYLASLVVLSLYYLGTEVFALWKESRGKHGNNETK